MEIILGVLVPSSTPRHIISRLHQEVAKIVADPEIKTRLAAVGFEAVGSSPEIFGHRLKAEIWKWSKVIGAANLRPPQ